MDHPEVLGIFLKNAAAADFVIIAALLCASDTTRQTVLEALKGRVRVKAMLGGWDEVREGTRVLTAGSLMPWLLKYSSLVGELDLRTQSTIEELKEAIHTCLCELRRPPRRNYGPWIDPLGDLLAKAKDGVYLLSEYMVRFAAWANGYTAADDRSGDTTNTKDRDTLQQHAKDAIATSEAAGIGLTSSILIHGMPEVAETNQPMSYGGQAPDPQLPEDWEFDPEEFVAACRYAKQLHPLMSLEAVLEAAREKDLDEVVEALVEIRDP